ncbi:phosphoglycerate mutase family protein [Bifidobacterium saguini DSM 23967]|uniref:Phosphoglycerate mutase family protein n=2 Tax=Bifidobacterium saguini TaxID=762210 RepID=A0A087D6T4_9BIFI|nr:histidine phosphatase family protein [Bifidobacterium saguini]KFI91234.1 phosphoglycerate mutase family protein [Bifidobacterium saguini DSM 23967]QTB91198.1 histidine phosphatase family protein [Bifidobacterium saguini]
MALQHVRSIFLVRHGRTSYNAAHKLQGQVDIPLDAVGQWQVKQTAAALKDLYVDRRPETDHRLIVCSDLVRAHATAQAFADALGGAPVHDDVRVRERSFGDWDGHAVSELAQRYPEDFRSWMEHRGGEMKYHAEAKEDVGKRGVEALEDWSTRAGMDTDLFVFSHGAWISQTLQTLLGLSKVDSTFASLLSMRNAHWVRLIPMDIEGEPTRWRLLDYNHGPAIADTDEWEKER